MNLLPEPDRDNRYKVLARHRQYLENNFQLTGEFGLISDRNFLEQYFEPNGIRPRITTPT